MREKHPGKGGEKPRRQGFQSGWDPSQYLTFADLRLRPALELLASVPLIKPTSVVDLGCGTGNVTRYLRERWPNARIVGVDNSADMLRRAEAEALEGVSWEAADLESWQPEAPVEVLYSNAALHWATHHETLFPRLLSYLAPGGVLAVQMPRNFGAPSHQLMYQVARQGPWAERLNHVHRRVPVEPPTYYYNLLADRVTKLEIWETEYLQVLEGDHPVAEFTKGTWLKPMLDALEEPDRGAFEQAYRLAVRDAYPPQADGRTLFPFRRVFILATV